MKKSIVWMASYPKSGNTWTRIFLANYIANASQPIPINVAHRFAMGDSIAKTYRMVAGRPIDTDDIDLTLSLRPAVLRGIVGNNADINLVKTHNIRAVARGVPLIPEEFTRSAIYIVRNPLDMVLSYARHYGMTPEEAVYTVSHVDNANPPSPETVAQFMGSWSDHVRSWTGPSPYPVLVLRYEDLLADPKGNFAKVLEHLGVPVEAERLDRAIQFASFKELSMQEAEQGFVEKSAESERFFAKGKSDQWKTDLEPRLVKRMQAAHRKVMKQFGYLK
ncbi:sulfotransferase domain-containing protein [Roseovarius mucosus]|uniref:sulfotransferase domain-containing protein n=1 Tax=Roseovarius mucosus TaxID=215743 RepID=UPI001C5E8A4B|nr:sulfotransferase domain-containing protein [Roseovarius mucosus]MBW4973599.1 sulfotransferase domain-containing protein [Roseovarius mucosus]